MSKQREEGVIRKRRGKCKLPLERRRWCEGRTESKLEKMGETVHKRMEAGRGGHRSRRTGLSIWFFLLETAVLKGFKLEVGRIRFAFQKDESGC